ncbi:MAG: YHS domain-containing protein [Rhodospirillales bacterium]|nr:YHS domain-containing protein [Rhodospirillales bacterium]MBN8928552.1 YHS domain-containing protein [Rhodospirillales bacterium]
MQVTDPVCGMALESTKAAASETVNKQTYYFCSASCHNQFRTYPDRYVAKERAQKGDLDRA